MTDATELTFGDMPDVIAVSGLVQVLPYPFGNLSVVACHQCPSLSIPGSQVLQHPFQPCHFHMVGTPTFIALQQGRRIVCQELEFSVKDRQQMYVINT